MATARPRTQSRAIARDLLRSDIGRLIAGPYISASAESEDCLFLSIWTPGVNDNRKRPVMFWLHGGGFTTGGSGLATHRRESGAARRRGCGRDQPSSWARWVSRTWATWEEKFAHSGNVGMLDAVAALEWVRENVERFGGEPTRVMIFGESGGGRRGFACCWARRQPRVCSTEAVVIESGPAVPK